MAKGLMTYVPRPHRSLLYYSRSKKSTSFGQTQQSHCFPPLTMYFVPATQDRPPGASPAAETPIGNTSASSYDGKASFPVSHPARRLEPQAETGLSQKYATSLSLPGPCPHPWRQRPSGLPPADTTPSASIARFPSYRRSLLCNRILFHNYNPSNRLFQQNSGRIFYGKFSK